MRIIGGKYKGRIIRPPSGLRARPTTDFARESLFNILSNRIDFESVTVLDLFGGTGSISFEFASRGVPEIHLVEFDVRHIAGIKKIIKEIGIEGIKPVHIDMKAFLKTCREKYDIIFADPPYDLLWFSEIPDLIMNSSMLKENGTFILEHPRGMNFKSHRNFTEHRNYGSVNFCFFKAAL